MLLVTPTMFDTSTKNFNKKLQNNNSLTFGTKIPQKTSVKHTLKTLAILPLVITPVILPSCINTSDNKTDEKEKEKIENSSEIKKLNVQVKIYAKETKFDPESEFYGGIRSKHAQAIMKVLNYNDDHNGHKITKIKNTFLSTIRTYLDDGSFYREYMSVICVGDHGAIELDGQRNHCNERIIIKPDKNGEFEIQHTGRTNGDKRTFCYKFDKNGKLKQALPPDAIQKTLNEISIFDNYGDLKTILANIMAVKKINSVDFKINKDNSVTIYAEQDNASYKIQLRDDNGTLYGLVNKFVGNDSQIYAIKMIDESTNKIKRLLIAKERVVSDMNGENIQPKNQTESHSNVKVNDYKVCGGIFSKAMLPTDIDVFTKHYISEQAEYTIYTYNPQTQELKQNNNVINTNYSTAYEVF